MGQDVIAFPVPASRSELAELDRQLKGSLLIGDIAERLYHARTLHLGGEFLDWNDLSPKQREAFRSEVEQLIKGEL